MNKRDSRQLDTFELIRGTTAIISIPVSTTKANPAYPSGAETEIYRPKWVNTMDADTLATSVARTPIPW